MTLREKLLVLLFNQPLKKADAIILLEGDGSNRLRKAVDLYKEEWARLIVFSGAADDPAHGSIIFSKLRSIFTKSGIPENKILLENKSQNTRDQAVEVMELISKNGWKRIILVASHYHQLRAFLTFLKSMKEKKLKIEIINAPANNLSWFEQTPWGRRIDLLEEEFKKIKRYQKHTVSFKEGIRYLQWLEQ